ncbi:MAG: glycosyltransferase family 2 protein [Acidimicrobiales bacterium]
MPNVTIVMPTYRRPDLLANAIESVLAQTHRDFVLFIGDNSPDDASEQVALGYGDPRIVYRRNEVNLGSQGNWLALIRDATTPLVATLHDDDAWHPDFLESLVPLMVDDPTIAMAFSDFDVVDGNGNPLVDLTEQLSHRTHRDRLPEGRHEPSLDEALRLSAVWNTPQPELAAVVRRDEVMATDFPEDTAWACDLWLTYNMLVRGCAVWYVRRRLVDYRWHGGSLTSSSASLSQAEDLVFERILANHPTAGPVLDEVRAYWADLRWGRAVEGIDAGVAGPEIRRQLAAASPALPPMRRLMATVGGSSSAGLALFRAVRSLESAVTRRVAPV